LDDDEDDDFGGLFVVEEVSRASEADLSIGFQVYAKHNG
jgi:hypothetical protein